MTGKYQDNWSLILGVRKGGGVDDVFHMFLVKKAHVKEVLGRFYSKVARVTAVS